ncbi:MAG: zf-HC2 domain-containing protein [Chloroflexi bacterium]|nr:zf-HC2 domain-containing protein [Chloroflexota bacterium]
MSCVDVGTLRAFVDGELRDDERRLVERHVADCRDCRRVLEEVTEVSSWAGSQLASLDPVEMPEPGVALPGVRQKLVAAGNRRSVPERLVSAFNRQWYRFGAAAAALLLTFSIVLVYAPARSAAEGFLGVFRVQKFQAVQVDPAKMPRLPAPTNIGEFSFTRDPKIETVASIEEARKRMSFDLRAPGNVPSSLLPTPAVMVSSEAEAALTIDLDKLNAYLASIGATNVSLPPSLDGATVKVKISPEVGLVYSDKTFAQLKAASDGAKSPPSDVRILFVAQGRSPVMEGPSNLDWEQLRSQLLQMPGLPPEFVAQVRGIHDWQQTLLVPVVGGTSRNVTVDGVQGILVTSKEHGMVVALWQKNDVLYAVGGNLTESDVLGVANSLK